MRHAREPGPDEVPQFPDGCAAKPEKELPRIDAVRAKRPVRLPIVASRAAIRRVLDGVVGAGGLFRLMAELPYGSGLRRMDRAGSGSTT